MPLFLRIWAVMMILAANGLHASPEDRLAPYLETLSVGATTPVDYVLGKLATSDLLLFDDALHSAVEPFEFYRDLVRTPAFQEAVRFIFLEVVSVSQQPALDAYMASDSEDVSLLYPAFQNDFSGTGMPYGTYFDLLKTIREVNVGLPETQRFQVVAVNAATYWPEIRTHRDVELFRRSLAGNDYTMYRVILSLLDEFRSGDKGVFLTNTRHAYKNIRKGDGTLYWNCGTFFHQLHPGRTTAIRFHNVQFRFLRKRNPDDATPRTTEGLERVVLEWGRMEKGLWDTAFAAAGNEPAGFDIAGTPFGRAAYVGNHMLDALPGQTMQDAYDGLIFLAPLEHLHQTALVGDMYTPGFKREIARRLAILFTPAQLEERISKSGGDSLDDYIEATFRSRQASPLPMLEGLEPMDGWR